MCHKDNYLEAVCDAPDNDVPRLEYATWLTQKGDPRGEFIRLQCELAGIPAGESRHQELNAQVQELLKLHEQEWLGALWGKLSAWTFARGFLDSVTVDGTRYFPTSDGLGPYMYRSPLNAEGLAELLLLLPPTPRELALPGNCLGQDGTQLLVGAQHLKLLTVLDLSGFQPDSKATDWDPYESNIGSAGAGILADSDWSSRLRELDLSLNRIDDEAAVAIASSPHLQGLRRLTIHESNDEPYLSGEAWFAEATIERLRTSFGSRLSLDFACPGGSFEQEVHRHPPPRPGG
jgi:uncharacterized protein (TIGR02996 family)